MVYVWFGKTYMEKENRNMKKIKWLNIVAVVCFILFGIMTYKGYDKMTNYYSSEIYASLNVNAYVGGDAYNYIINGTYATSFFVLAIGFLISGILCVVGGVLVDSMSAQKVETRCQNVDVGTKEDELPPL